MSSEADIFEQIKLFLPKYLTPERKRELFVELSRFPNITSFYFDGGDLREQFLQGDGWRGFIAIDFSTGDRKVVSGVILSNSCDISLENAQGMPVRILLAPLIALKKYAAVLQLHGKTKVQIEGMLDIIRKQRVTSIFYLPHCPGSIEESIILLDDIHAHPLADFLGRDRTVLFKLNQTFFYIFLIKLSIHFSRFQESVQRYAGAA